MRRTCGRNGCTDVPLQIAHINVNRARVSAKDAASTALCPAKPRATVPTFAVGFKQWKFRPYSAREEDPSCLIVHEHDWSISKKLLPADYRVEKLSLLGGPKPTRPPSELHLARSWARPPAFPEAKAAGHLEKEASLLFEASESRQSSLSQPHPTSSASGWGPHTPKGQPNSRSQRYWSQLSFQPSTPLEAAPALPATSCLAWLLEPTGLNGSWVAAGWPQRQKGTYRTNPAHLPSSRSARQSPFPPNDAWAQEHLPPTTSGRWWCPCSASEIGKNKAPLLGSPSRPTDAKNRPNLQWTPRSELLRTPERVLSIAQSTTDQDAAWVCNCMYVCMHACNLM